MATRKKPAPEIGPIVSASHLAASGMPALSEVEFALEMTHHAFGRWMVRCMAAAGVPGLSALDVFVLHTVNHRGRVKTVSDICLVLNIEDTHTVSYTLKKLERLGLVTASRIGKEKAVGVTEEGEAACLRYREIREKLLVEAIRALGLDEKEMSRMAALMRALSGHYDQAARAAVAL
ncbi:winged helix DNA-binding protein [Afifella pfennigii]|uniref:winged helix DNA-binding protein n=1 Tax=Afifella pfennigii TaxID=209897 RepID=UPI00047A640F|nr:winged helix DNA-binding protein [Afifella pfennigii]